MFFTKKIGRKSFSVTRRFTVSRKLQCKNPVPSDLDISKSITPLSITQVAAKIGILPEELEQYGKLKAKIRHEQVTSRLKNVEKGKLICVTGINPTPFGEGKTTMAVGMAQSMKAHLNWKTFCNIRQPSLGPVFGIKGGAAGGGYSQVIPMEEFNLHLTGDFHAVSIAHNLLAAAADVRMIHETNQSAKSIYRFLCPKKKGKRIGFVPSMRRRLNKLGINKIHPDELNDDEIKQFVSLNLDPEKILWKRVIDLNDRALRKIKLACGERNFSRNSGFDISSASECMAILSLSNNVMDMKQRISEIVVGLTRKGELVTADDIGCAGAMTVLMRDTINPNLMQTLESSPVFVHGGPFANIAHGCSSVIADDVALRLVGKDGYVLTEAGFGADIGLEKFINIKCRKTGLRPHCIVIVATIQALKMHGGGSVVMAGKPLPKEYTEENVELVKLGCINLCHHIRTTKNYGVPIVVCINAFPGDSNAELNIVRESALQAGAFDAVPCKSFEYGGEGAKDISKVVSQACNENSKFQLLYPDEMSLEKKIKTIAKTYNAKQVTFSDIAQVKLQEYTKLGYGKYPICMAKTPYSLSTNPDLKGAPYNFVVHVNDVRLNAGAGFVVAYLGDIMTMPGLTTRPAFFDIDINKNGEISGLF